MIMKLREPWTAPRLLALGPAAGAADDTAGTTAVHSEIPATTSPLAS